jgi:uncharacterized spore protein YtfJ
MKAVGTLVVLLLLLSVLVGCAPGPNQLVNSANEKGQFSGFWQGLWHGFISPVTFIISLFSKSVQVYEVHNNGNWYNFGFLLGVIIIFGGGAGGSAARRSRQVQ